MLRTLLGIWIHNPFAETEEPYQFVFDLQQHVAPGIGWAAVVETHTANSFSIKSNVQISSPAIVGIRNNTTTTYPHLNVKSLSLSTTLHNTMIQEASYKHIF